MNYKSILESLLFVVGDEGLLLNEIELILNINKDELDKIISSLEEDYADKNRGIMVTVLGDRLKLITKKENKEYFQKLNKVIDKNLTNSSLEVLAIVAYNQPVTRSMVDEIRGVSSAHYIRKLYYLDMICEVGRSETAGRPILYGTTSSFLDYLGLKSITELPMIEVSEFDYEDNLYNSKYKEN